MPENPRLSSLGMNGILFEKVRSSTKTKIARTLPIIDEIRECVATIGSNPFVFTNPLGRPYSVKMLSERWGKACKSAHEKYGVPIIGM